ncbi:MAG: S8 family serine peptidase [Saprospiraceae bacterium]|nr:S8 family serine peptidase [Saprospiraceae bacterium]MCB0625269.1 S8 family serine peptidase [Saprospiraceae bacterium]MCB0680348.1 S8 family serine peptidase [Saprospiraceae bacterium]
MKIRLLLHQGLITVLICCIGNNLFSQDAFLYVYPVDSSAYPTGLTPFAPDTATANSILNDLFESYGVTKYFRSFMTASPTASYYDAHTIHLTGNPDSLLLSLQETGLFSSIEKAQFAVVEGCSNPVSVDDPAVDWTWNYDITGVECAWSISTGDPNFPVGVIDIAFEEDHDDLENTLTLVWESTPNSNANTDCDHGSGVAGIICAEPNNDFCLAGMGYDTPVHAYAIEYHLNANGQCQADGDLFPALLTASQNGLRVVNLSWAGQASPSQEIVLQDVIANGTVVVFAGTAGNWEDIWEIPGTITVARGTINLNYFGDIPSTPTTDLIAPARFIYKLYENNTCNEIVNAGSSIAAPHVAATAALMFDLVPCLRPAEVETIIKATTMPINNASDPNDQFYGVIDAGYLNIYDAVRYTDGDIDPITDDEEWDNPRYINGEVEIKEDARLTISSTIRFGANARIRVKRGAELVVDGGTLTNGCGERWQGIIVEGNPSTFQAVSPYTGVRDQGYVELNNAVIENALYGVRLYDPEAANTGGGILVAHGSEFINNIYAVAFAPYQNFSPYDEYVKLHNLSSFSECVFIVNNDFPGNYEDFAAHVFLKRVTGIEFIGCEFRNEISKSNYTYADDAKVAISSRDANFTVTKVCESEYYPPEQCEYEKRSVFEGFATAISAYNISTINTFVVTYTDFSDNYTCISASKVDNIFVANNVFEVGMGLSGLYNPYRGINLQGCTAYKVEENEFSDSKTALTSEEMLGIVIVTSGNQPNEIYKNTLEGLDFGNISNGDNRGQQPFEGLIYRCNENDENQYDFGIPDENVSSWGIAQNQGSLLKSASNSWTSDPQNDHTHFWNLGSNFTYFHASGDAPTHYTTNTIDLNPNAEVNQCNSQLPGDGYYGFLSDSEKQSFSQAFSSSSDPREESYVANMLIRDYLIRDSLMDLDSARTWLANKGDLHSDFLIVDSWLQENRPDSAQAALNAISTNYSLSGSTLAEYNQFEALKSIQIDAQLAEVDEDQMILDSLSVIGQIAESGEYLAAFQAQNMINAVSGPTYERIIILPEEIERSMEAPNNDIIEPADWMASDVYLSVSPNPLPSTSLTVNYSLPEQAGLNELLLQDIHGGVLKVHRLQNPSDKLLINLADISDGVYFYTLTSDGVGLRTVKLVDA